MRYAIVVVGLCLHFGCNKPTASVPSTVSPSGSKVVLLYVWTNGADGNSEVEKIENPDWGQIEKKVRSLDWSNAQVMPDLTLRRDQDNDLAIHGVLNATNDEDRLSASWSERPGNETVVTHRHYKPLDSLDTALSLLRSYFQDDGQYRTLVPWEVDE